MTVIERLATLSDDTIGQSPGLTNPTHDKAQRALAHSVGWRSAKVGPRHLERLAIVYVRQSSQQQVLEHRESLARQYALRDRAVALGWSAADVMVIDEDLGRSGRSSENRLGFQRLLAEVAQGRVGLVLALEASRLARNSKDWHNLFELCGVRDTLLADDDGVYDPRDVNDRLLLGLKGIMSEMELHVMRGRLERGRRNKAERGELFHSVPWGYVLLPDGTVEFDADEQVRSTVRRLFATFRELGSAFAVLRDLRRHDVKLPKRDPNGRLVWRVATETIVNTALHHPLYAGAYAWGRRQTQTHVDAAGRIAHSRQSRPPDEWTVLLRDRCPAYITWDEYLANQRTLLENLHRPDTKGTPRGGSALLTGVLYCGRCGRKMQVLYTGTRGGRYTCSRRRIEEGDDFCGSLPAQGLDEHVAEQVLQALSPAALELSLCSVEHAAEQRRRKDEQLRQSLARAIYETQRAERQFEAVEPENRLVARTLEQRWEAALQQQRTAQEACDRFLREKPVQLSPCERQSLEYLSRDIPALWHAAETTFRDRQEIVRCLIERVNIVLSTTDQQVDVAIRWAGGYESQQEFRRPVGLYSRLDDVVELLGRVGELRRAGWRSPRIAEQLNAEGFRTPKQRGPFTADVVRTLFPRVIAAEQAQDGAQRPSSQWPADALARRLAMREKKLKDWVRRGWVRVLERPFGGVWILWADEQELQRLERLVTLSRTGRNPPAELTTPRPVCIPEGR